MAGAVGALIWVATDVAVPLSIIEVGSAVAAEAFAGATIGIWTSTKAEAFRSAWTMAKSITGTVNWALGVSEGAASVSTAARSGAFEETSAWRDDDVLPGGDRETELREGDDFSIYLCCVDMIQT